MENKSLLSNKKLLMLSYLLREIIDLPGDMAELGVYTGGSARLIGETVPNKLLHLFDTFTGIPEDDLCGSHKKGDFGTDLKSVIKYMEGLNVKFYVGIFPYTAEKLDTFFSFVHVDADTYQSTVAAIRYFYPRMVSGGIMLFDDYEWHKCPGVKKAILEYFSLRSIKPCGEHQCVVRKTKRKRIFL